MNTKQINVGLFNRCKQLEQELATLRAKAEAYDEVMSIPLQDGTRLRACKQHSCMVQRNGCSVNSRSEGW